MSDISARPASPSVPTEAPLPPVNPVVEAWARALCLADVVNPDKIIGNPPAPRWRSYVRYAGLAIRAKAIVEAAQ